MSSPSPEPVAVGSSSETSAHIKKLGYVVGKHVNLHGEHMVFVADPFDDGDCVAFLAVNTSNPTVRKTELPHLFLPAGRTCFWGQQIPLPRSLLQLAVGLPTLLTNKAQNDPDRRSHNDQPYA